MRDEGIVRNRMKIASAVSNARAYLKVVEQLGSFDAYVWKFVDGQPIVNRWKTSKQIPPRSKESDALDADLKKRGFSFASSTIMYAHMQACGLVNDHLVDCFRYEACKHSSMR